MPAEDGKEIAAPRDAEADAAEAGTEAEGAPERPSEDIRRRLEDLEDSYSFQIRRKWWIKNSPFWIISISLHVVLFSMLAFLTITESRREKLLRQSRPATSSGRRGAVDYQARIDRLLLMNGGEAESQEGRLAGNIPFRSRDWELAFTPLIGSTTPEAGALRVQRRTDEFDLFAFETINSLARGTTNIVFLVSESWERPEADLARVEKGLTRYFDVLELYLKQDFLSRGRWGVYRVGKGATRVCELTGDLGRVQRACAALRAGRPDGDGRLAEENILRVVNAALKDCGGRARYTLVAVLTNTGGTDLGSDFQVDVAIGHLQNRMARLYVFGGEGSFGRRTNKRRTAAPGPELWRGEFLWGADTGGVASGFGAYGLNRLVLSSAGIYFLLTPESTYDGARLHGHYQPDVCSRREYRRRVVASPLRRALVETWAGLDAMEIPSRVSSVAEAGQSITMAMKHRTWARQQADELAELAAVKSSERYWMRWLAHAQLTRAELLRREYLLEQYILRLQSAEGDLAVLERDQGFAICPGDEALGKGAGAQFAAVVAALDAVIRDHANTPWAELARRIRSKLSRGVGLKPIKLAPPLDMPL